jgi:hypothetical protein
MRIRTVVIAAAAALALAASALAASTAKDPSVLILQKKDFPVGADYEPSTPDDLDLKHALTTKGIAVSTAGYLGATFSAKKGMLTIHGAVVATPSVGTAKRAFGIVVKARQGFWKTLGAPLQPTSGAPSYGDQQIALSKKPSVLHDGTIDLVVRKRTVVWLIEVVLRRQPLPQMSEILADLKAYASKQKTRVGVG